MKNSDFLMTFFAGGILFFLTTIVIHIILNISRSGFSQSLMNIPLNDASWYSFAIFIFVLIFFTIKNI